MTSKREQFYKRRIAELEAQLKECDQRIATLQKQLTELLKVNAELAEKVAKQQDLPPKSATISKRFRKHGDALFRFLFDPAVPPTNNAAEQTLRQAIIDRRITQVSRSLMGRQWNSRIWMVLATCRKQGRSSWQLLQNALSAYYLQTPIPSLLPQPN